jgi:hypothetical protein
MWHHLLLLAVIVASVPVLHWVRTMARGPLLTYSPPIASEPPWFADKQLVKCCETGEFFVFDQAANTLSRVQMPPAPEPHFEAFPAPERLPTAFDITPEPPRRPPAEVIPLRARTAPWPRSETLYLRRPSPTPQNAAERQLLRELAPSPALTSRQIDQAIRELRQANAQLEHQHVSVADGIRRYYR